MDIVSSEKRSQMMAGIKAKNTKPEMVIRQRLHALGYRYRLHEAKIPGKPDIVLKKYNALIFIHGCFWHGHECDLFRLPKTRTEFWHNKIEENRRRDDRVLSELLASGWRIAIIWECAIRGKNRINFDGLIDGLCEWIQSDRHFIEYAGKRNDTSETV